LLSIRYLDLTNPSIGDRGFDGSSATKFDIFFVDFGEKFERSFEGMERVRQIVNGSHR
jgi:hypothetical protein